MCVRVRVCVCERERKNRRQQIGKHIQCAYDLQHQEGVEGMEGVHRVVLAACPLAEAQVVSSVPLTRALFPSSGLGNLTVGNSGSGSTYMCVGGEDMKEDLHSNTKQHCAPYILYAT